MTEATSITPQDGNIPKGMLENLEPSQVETDVGQHGHAVTASFITPSDKHMPVCTSRALFPGLLMDLILVLSSSGA